VTLRKLLREPLVQFVLIGVSIFLLSEIVGDSRDETQPTIIIDAGEVERIVQVWQRMRMRPPTDAELDELIDEHIRGEVMYREALAMGLDKDDAVIRHRLKQKLEFLSTNLMTLGEPGDEELQGFFEENRESYREPDRITFAQVYFSPSARKSRTEEDARKALRELVSASFDSLDAIEAEGDPIELDARYRRVTLAQVRKRFGARFADALTKQPLGRWSGPIESGFGLHNVYIEEKIPGELPPLSEIRHEVLRDYEARARQEASDAFYEKVKERYKIIVEEGAKAGAKPLESARQRSKSRERASQ